MFNRQSVENVCKELGIPVDVFYQEGNHLSFGGFRGTQELEPFIKIFSPHLNYEKVNTDKLTIEEWEGILNKIKNNKYIVGWFIVPGLNTNIWYALDEEVKDAAELAGGLLNFLQLN